MSRDRWTSRKEADAMRFAIERAGSVKAWIRSGLIKHPITDDVRTRHAAANALADRYGYPRPYPDLDAYPRADDSGPSQN